MTFDVTKEEFNTYKPRGSLRLLLILVRLGFGFGKLKKLLSKAIKNINGEHPIDIIYHQLNLRVFPHNNTIESKMLVSSKLREAKELSFIEPFIKGGGTFVDIGANIGYYSLMAAKLGAKKVLSIEPNPIVLNRFKLNISFNNYGHIIQSIQMGVGEKQGLLELNVSELDMGSSSVIHSVKVGDKKITIEVDLLENILSKANIKNIDVLKIDIEGFEDRALFPFFQNLDKNQYPKLILMEDSSLGGWKRNILEWLLANGYRELGRTRGNVIITTE